MRQFAVCGALHDAALGGTALIQTNNNSEAELIDALQHAWSRTDIRALRFVNAKEGIEKESERSFLDD
jgi:hypothetical protein